MTAELPRGVDTPNAIEPVARCRIIVLAKAPQAGRVKTRLIPRLGADGAARLARQMLDHSLQAALGSQLGPVRLCAAPDPGHRAFGPWCCDDRIERDRQIGADLGQRMAAALLAALREPLLVATAGARHRRRTSSRTTTTATTTAPIAPALADRSLLIGTDAPALDAGCLRACAAALDDRPVVFVPTHDGGYALVGLHRRALTSTLPRRPGAAEIVPSHWDTKLLSRLFADITWSTATVMAQTRRRLDELGCAWTESAPLHDIDEPADLIHCPPAWLLAGG